MTPGLASAPTPEPITSVEEFVPDGGVLDRSFLEDTNIHERGTQHLLEAESDRWVFIGSEEDNGGLHIGECACEWLGNKAKYISEYMNIPEQDIWSRIK